MKRDEVGGGLQCWQRWFVLLGYRSSGSRKQYASLDINTMGVDIDRGPITELDNKVGGI
jgi:hypothetical protein